MPVPKRKTSKARRDKRSANKFIRPKSVTSCSNCEKAISTHQACSFCGFYKGKKVLTTKIERALKRNEIRAEKQKAEAEKTNAMSDRQESQVTDQNHENEK